MQPETTAEQIQAAATGAAAAVAAVADEQAESERAENMQAAVAEASLNADVATEQAQEAAQAAQHAADAANQAVTESQQAAEVAVAAADVAYATKDDVAALRQDVQNGWSDLRSYLDQQFNPAVSDQPTEVVVTNEPAAAGADNPAHSRADASGTGSAGENGDTPVRRRHRFGR